MGLDKFFDLLRKRRLVFNRADNFTDKNELVMHSLHQPGVSASEEKKWNSFRTKCLELKESTFVSSWSAQKNESFGLWKVYLGGNNPGVAIKTNYHDLTNSLRNKDCQIFSGKVQYHDSRNPSSLDYIYKLNDDQLITTKYAGYEYEHEVRLFLRLDNPSESSKKVVGIAVDLDTLIQEIYLSPWIASWFQDTFREIVENLEPSLSRKIVESRISDYG